jgi:hypothetical protein
VNLRRLTLAETLGVFGDPTPFLRDDGTVSPKWEQQIVAYATLPAPMPLSWNPAVKVTRCKCHRLLVGLLEQALAAIHADAEVWATVGDFGGCYEFRARRKASPNESGLGKLSMHAWAAAIDLDVCDNPMGRAPNVHPRLPGIMAAHGFLWGGTFPTRWRDPMHFEAADLSLLGAH